MDITISPKIDAALHPTIRRVIVLGFWGVNRDEVRVRVDTRKDTYWSGSCRPTLRRVRLRIPRDPPSSEGGEWPRMHQEHRLKTAPEVFFSDWKDQLLYLAAHEASHIRQHDRPAPSSRRVGVVVIPRQSELAAERWAANVLERQGDKIDLPRPVPYPLNPILEEIMNEGPDLIDYLVAKQELAGFNDTAFQRFIGLPDLSTWLRYKRRERPPPLRLMQLAARRWPKERAAIFEAAMASPVRGGTEAIAV